MDNKTLGMEKFEKDFQCVQKLITEEKEDYYKKLSEHDVDSINVGTILASLERDGYIKRLAPEPFEIPKSFQIEITKKGIKHFNITE